MYFSIKTIYKGKRVDTIKTVKTGPSFELLFQKCQALKLEPRFSKKPLFPTDLSQQAPECTCEPSPHTCSCRLPHKSPNKLKATNKACTTKGPTPKNNRTVCRDEPSAGLHGEDAERERKGPGSPHTAAPAVLATTKQGVWTTDAHSVLVITLHTWWGSGPSHWICWHSGLQENRTLKTLQTQTLNVHKAFCGLRWSLQYLTAATVTVLIALSNKNKQSL